MILDKTGTVTVGAPSVTNVIEKTMTEEEALVLAGSLEKQSEHPLGETIYQFAQSRQLAMPEVQNFSQKPEWALQQAGMERMCCSEICG